MLLTLTTTARPATDLGFLLHKHPDRAQRFDTAAGGAHVFYPEATEERCTAALLLDIDPVGLVRGKGPRARGGEAHYVDDRPYAASSLLAVAMAAVFATAMTGTCKARPELATTPIPLEIRVPALPCRRGGAALVERLFAPLGWRVAALPAPLDPLFPEWGPAAHHDVTLRGTARLADALTQLYVLLPVLDDTKHYYVGRDEIDKLVREGANWLPGHPERGLIARRYLAHRTGLASAALSRLGGVEDIPDEGVSTGFEPGLLATEGEAGSDLETGFELEGGSGLEAERPEAGGETERPEAGGGAPPGGGRAGDTQTGDAQAAGAQTAGAQTAGAQTAGAQTAGAEDAGAGEEEPPGGTDQEAPAARQPSLAVLRRRAVLDVLRSAGARRVADLGCGDGRLVGDLLADPRFTEIVAVDVSHRALELAARRLRVDRLPDRVRARLRLVASSLTYRDARIAGLDAAVLSEVVEHVDPPRLGALAAALLGEARPRLVVITTPNVEYNVRYEGLAPGALRHRDHRFEWTRDEFAGWVEDLVARYPYTARLGGGGAADPELGAPTQLAVLERIG
ncbi:3' terminal RNA ribose 2'-O-methyltransferase Hen1 [Frankia sp. CNm7]|uniref:3' terminal RNA ribose 2'-O-methyltransferase Hen1 n=1 Tax=Frankia nepalensis TaxID=1836974 RepID=UPI00193324FF|nr:3' terminal RNA ribose 2'-O-methyltransferase Hen1 [Frankia nepalensis]MBL7521930.1 3' terminal RNA ribose 2'-O-methyltransferase Hen1 [Frankia nepalensis]